MTAGKPQVFLCWAGDQSKAAALLFRDWLQTVIQGIETWISAEDIRKGAFWREEIQDALLYSRACLIFLTPENLGERWPHYEAGIVLGANQARRLLASRTDEEMPSTIICPYLLGVTVGQVEEPFRGFQLTTSTKEDTWALVKTIAGLVNADEGRLQDVFERFWDDLETPLEELKAAFAAKKKSGALSKEQIVAQDVERAIVLSTVRIGAFFHNLPEGGFKGPIGEPGEDQSPLEEAIRRAFREQSLLEESNMVGGGGKALTWAHAFMGFAVNLSNGLNEVLNRYSALMPTDLLWAVRQLQTYAHMEQTFYSIALQRELSKRDDGHPGLRENLIDDRMMLFRYLSNAYRKVAEMKSSDPVD